MFHSFHAARASEERLAAMRTAIGADLAEINQAATYTYPGITMPAAMTTAAACNHLWISCPNSSAPESCWPAFFVRADGVTTRAAAPQPAGGAADQGGHQPGPVRLHGGLAGPGHGRGAAQRRAGHRRPVGRPHIDLGGAEAPGRQKR